jgi:hypothetical protein
MLRNRRIAALVALSALTLVAISGCGGGNKTSAAKTGSTASPSSSTGQTYTSRAFVVPLTVTVDPSLESRRRLTPGTSSPGIPRAVQKR